jgi:PadR family transcriptional regulator PadR
MERLVELGFEAMNPGTLYRALRKTEKDGLCESKWETTCVGPAHRMYSITDAREAYLGLWVKSLEHYQQMMEAFSKPVIVGGAADQDQKDQLITLLGRNT